jgi:hypothetical protein
VSNKNPIQRILPLKKTVYLEELSNIIIINYALQRLVVRHLYNEYLSDPHILKNKQYLTVKTIPKIVDHASRMNAGFHI